jgi:hypothetical protein
MLKICRAIHRYHTQLQYLGVYTLLPSVCLRFFGFVLWLFCLVNYLERIVYGRFTALGKIFYIDQGKSITENVLTKLNSINCFLNIWKSTRHTPLGKITVIKSLTLPIIVEELGPVTWVCDTPTTQLVCHLGLLGRCL